MQEQLQGSIQKHEKFASQFLQSRDVLVYLPPGYESSPTHRFPVLYMHDGQNLFDPTTAFGEDWKVDSTAEGLIQKGEIEPIILVGIANTGEKRIDEYTPTKDEKKQKGGEADKYGQMLVSELKPFIDRLYRTLPDAANTGLGGSSLGGLITMHLGLRHSQVFGKLAVLSPSVWWDSREIIHEVEALQSKLPLRIWLDAGTKEGPEVTSDARALRDALVAKGWKLDEDLKYFEAEGAEHNERAWGSRVDRVLKYLFPKQNPPA
jgi:predicted alpha/beta superfamily hydrolase